MKRFLLAILILLPLLTSAFAAPIPQQAAVPQVVPVDASPGIEPIPDRPARPFPVISKLKTQPNVMCIGTGCTTWQVCSLSTTCNDNWFMTQCKILNGTSFPCKCDSCLNP
jgi:hypothetical protein